MSKWEPIEQNTCWTCRHLDKRIVLTSIPPQYNCKLYNRPRYADSLCIDDESKEPKPTQPPYPSFTVPESGYPNCCQNCSNNPANNPLASGICCCSLPDLERAGWTGSRSWSKTYTTDRATITKQPTGTSTNTVLIARESPSATSTKCK